MAPRSGRETREKLLDAAEALILEQGFAATSIDQIIEKVGLTKGSFFYHFKTKNDLARALIDRYAAGDRRILEGNMERAETLSSDPLQQLLIFVGLLLELADQFDEETHPGCLFASYCYESGLFDGEINAVISEAILEWRTRLGAKLRAAAERHPPRMEVDPDSLADLITVIFEGSFVLTRTAGKGGVFAHQLRHYRNYLQLLFGA
jgi:TetR/AcrR family transcriptional repressor of nem operon